MSSFSTLGKLLEKAVFQELCRMLEGGELETKEKYAPKKGKPNVVMFVGLQAGFVRPLVATSFQLISHSACSLRP